MLSELSDWLHHRTRFRDLRDALLLEHIPGGARWRYVWGSTLAFVFVVQLLTGVLLMTAYSPGESTAWGSVYFIQYQMDFGWLIRGLHHFGSQTMVVLLGLHMLQVVIAGAHLPPREINWWLGLCLLGLVLGLALTGYLLPWDQKGLWATQVATSIAGTLPVIGPWLQKIIVGGPEYGHQTLTRFYALHVGVLPPLVLVFTVAHLAVFRRHGVTAPKLAQETVMFWPAQAFRDLIVCLLIFGVMLTLVLVGQGHAAADPSESRGLYESIAHAGQDGRGANLDAPADLEKPYPARPEWYFLFLFQLLKYFKGNEEILGTVLIPSAVGLLLFLLPLLGIGRLRRFGHLLGVVVVLGLVTAVGSLTCLAFADDSADVMSRAVLRRIGLYAIPALAGVLLLQLALLWLLRPGRARRTAYVIGVLVLLVLGAGVGSAFFAAVTDREIPELVLGRVRAQMKPEENKVPEDVLTFLNQRRSADQDAGRAIELAFQGIPDQGGKYLLRHDPMTRGPKLFAQQCGTCHQYPGLEATAHPKASDLADFGSNSWIRKLLENPGDNHYFGHTKLTTMAKWVKDTRGKTADQKELADRFDTIAQWLATHPRGKPGDDASETIKRGYQAFTQKRGGCVTCHAFAGGGGDSAPDLTNYGSAEWIRLMVMSPAHAKRYPATNEMPAFRNSDGPGAEVHLQEFKDANPNLAVLPLSDLDRELILRWLTGDSRVIFGGEAITGPAKTEAASGH